LGFGIARNDTKRYITMKADIIRQKFLEYFKARKHKVIESDSLLPKDDPTVLFTPAGMNQFKSQFLGQITDFRRAATSQRCLRTDDLDVVGKTTGHHTFFEMLGNFSFGDYFKKEAIQWAWEFLIQELKISPDKLWVSVYKDDAEAEIIWRQVIGLEENKLVRLGDKENFWPSEAKTKGPNGPCGPCSEIFFDFGVSKGCGKEDCNPSCGCGRFVEIWNLVFTQFNRKDGGVLEPLPQKNIDTGMGLERLSAVMQGVENNFETDLFTPMIKEITSQLCKDNACVIARSKARQCHCEEGEARRSNLFKTRLLRHFVPRNDTLRFARNDTIRELVYAVSDHIRAITFSIYDRVLPSNEGRGYIVRKLIRKSVLHLRELGIKKAFLHTLVAVLAKIMQQPYPELALRRENIAEVILAEEKNFIATLDSSDKLLKEKFTALLKDPDAQAAGKTAFVLHDTYGIPLELTKIWLAKHNLEFSQNSFEKEMSCQKERSKAKSNMQGDVFAGCALKLKLPATKFTGYKADKAPAKILAIIKDGRENKKAIQGDAVKIILDKTPFYAESGGQAGDSGEFAKGKNIFMVSNTETAGGNIIHTGVVKAGVFSKGQTLTAKIDQERRISIARNHTATHLLQAALRKVLGVHVQQQGSLVEAERLRFDFNHFKAIESLELSRIEEIVNNSIMSNYPLQKKEMTLALAKKSGALAFFAEKYASKVRVVSIGSLSKEFCGGTHLDYTGQIGYFRILQEGSIASGIRRIEAITGTYAQKLIAEQNDILADLASRLNTSEQKLSAELERKLKQIKELENQLNAQKLDSLKDNLEAIIQSAENIHGINLITKVFTGAEMDILRKNMDLIMAKTQNAVVALGSAQQGKALLVVGLTPDLVSKGVDAVKLIRQISGLIGGSGGGRSDFAQAGGNLPENFAQAFVKLKEII